MKDRFLLLAGASLVGTLLLGITLRAVFAGMPPPVGTFSSLRHTHSHLGYFGVLFPLLWWTWQRLGHPVPGPREFALYALATGVSVVGFLKGGYMVLSIAGSTVVLLVWLHSAWSVRRHLFAPRDWLTPALPAIVLSAVAIPGVALSDDPAYAAQLVQFFLTLLLLGCIVPAALEGADAPAPLGISWTLATIGTACALGPWPVLTAFIGEVALGLLLASSVLRSDLEVDLQMLWTLMALGLVALGSGLLPEYHQVAIAGLHFTLLGPVLLTLTAPRAPTSLRLVYEAVLIAFTLAVFGQAWGYALAPVAAWTGAATAVLLLTLLAWGSAHVSPQLDKESDRPR